MTRTLILGTGSYLPERVVTNDELATRFTTSDEWIQQRSGVRERRYAAPSETPATMGAEASRRALEAAGIGPKDLDFIICATQTPEYLFPGTGCVVQEQLGALGIGALDVRNQCTGFLYGLSIADAYIKTGTFRRILLVCTELHSRGLQFSDEGRHVTVLFGDGAGAVVLGPTEEEGRGLMSVQLHADGRYARDLMVEGPGFWSDPWCDPSIFEQGRHFPRMNGRMVFKEAVSCMRQVVSDTLAKNGLRPEDVDHFIPHQANRRINEAVADHFKLDEARVDHSIERYGNCAAASVPIALDERVRSGEIHPGQLLLFATFAAGFTWGGAAMRW
ncbi:MAG: ketoacyl-ACP synthase III [Armatimonadetes bacterium]|nr:ketoacyl-ACP synthase III [Armatimonadota bacterium]